MRASSPETRRTEGFDGASDLGEPFLDEPLRKEDELAQGITVLHSTMCNPALGKGHLVPNVG